MWFSVLNLLYFPFLLMEEIYHSIRYEGRGQVLQETFSTPEDKRREKLFDMYYRHLHLSAFQNSDELLDYMKEKLETMYERRDERETFLDDIRLMRRSGSGG
jgi:hypothetical protein